MKQRYFEFDGGQIVELSADTIEQRLRDSFDDLGAYYEAVLPFLIDKFLQFNEGKIYTSLDDAEEEERKAQVREENDRYDYENRHK